MEVYLRVHYKCSLCQQEIPLHVAEQHHLLLRCASFQADHAHSAWSASNAAVDF
jgi:hypothetical protein